MAVRVSSTPPATAEGIGEYPIEDMQSVNSVSFASPTIGFAVTPTELLYTHNGGHAWAVVRRFRLGITFVRSANTSTAWLLALGAAATGHGPYTLYRVTRSGRSMSVLAENPYFHPHSSTASGVPNANLAGWSSSGATAWLIASLPIGRGQYLWSFTANGGHSWSSRGTIRGAYEYYDGNFQPLSMDFTTSHHGWMVSNQDGRGEL